MFETTLSRNAKIRQIVLICCWLAVSFIGAVLHPSKSGHGTHTQLGLMPCPMVVAFNRPCPGCGLTTSWTNLIHGNIAESFHSHPLGPVLYGGFTALGVLSLLGLIWRKGLDFNSKKLLLGAKVAVAGLVVFGVARFALTPNYASWQERTPGFAAKWIRDR